MSVATCAAISAELGFEEGPSRPFIDSGGGGRSADFTEIGRSADFIDAGRSADFGG